MDGHVASLPPAPACLPPADTARRARTPQVKLSVLDKRQGGGNGKYIVVAGCTPTPLGEGKR